MILAVILVFSVFNITAEASTTKVWWDGVELKPGQIGRVYVWSDISVYKFDQNGKRVDVGLLKKGNTYRVYTYKPSVYGGVYGVGGGLYIHSTGAIKYETPSKDKLALANN